MVVAHHSIAMPNITDTITVYPQGKVVSVR
jgi:hypothetical protein